MGLFSNFMDEVKSNVDSFINPKELTFEEELAEEGLTLDVSLLVKETARAFARTLRQHLEEDNLTKDELYRKRKRTSALREAQTKAGYGDEASKKVIINSIKELVMDKYYGITEISINNIIHFNNPAKLSSNEKFEILFYLYNREFGEDGIKKMFEEHEFTKPIIEDGQVRYKVTKKRLAEAYNYVVEEGRSTFLQSVTLSYNDKVEILAQRIYEKYIGFSAADLLYYSPIDEIDAGVSGIPKEGFNVRSSNTDMPFSYESIWIMFKGLNIHMECLSFESQEELIRVCENIYTYDAPYVMSRSEGRVVATMIDGSRIVVVRPPFAESYMFFLRKFDSTPSVKPAELVIDANKAIPIVLMKWFIKGQRNIAITGSQGTGKSTWLKSVVRFIGWLNIRLQELQFELNLRYTYPYANIATFQETANISAQEGLNLQKKTNGAVNIIGEVANAIQASHIIQTAMVASLFAMFTHHAKTARDLVEAISNNLLELGLYRDKKDAVAMTAKVLNVDCHLSNVKYRHIERITEIIALGGMEYPSDKIDESHPLYDGVMSDNDDIRLEAMKEFIKTCQDTRTYQKRVTDPKAYETVDIMRWEAILDENGIEVGGIFKLVNMPSEGMMREIKDKLSYLEYEQFKKDLDMCKRLSDGETSEEIREWEQQILSQ